uniref:Uncharacterized protein n=1 Tax=Peronospora matthiolae TaxID=2874970 RepID=A0AAV1UXQ4_9STRA
MGYVEQQRRQWTVSSSDIACEWTNGYKRQTGSRLSSIRGSHGQGKFALRGGHLEMYESWDECAIREVPP